MEEFGYNILPPFQNVVPLTLFTSKFDRVSYSNFFAKHDIFLLGVALVINFFKDNSNLN